MHVSWDEVQLFLAVAERGSVTAAAKDLRITQPTASRRLTALESSLGEMLFVRGADGVTLTSFGERLIAPARRMAESAGEVERAVAGRDTTPRGVVRITAAPGVAYEFLAPFAASIRSVLPEVRLEVLANVQYLDLARREADLALRLGTAPSDLTTLATLEHGVAAFASPAYAKTLPRKPALRDIAWVGWAPPFESLPPMPELAAAIPGFEPVFASDDFLVQLRAAFAGIGAIFLGRLRHRFTDWPLVELDVDLSSIRRSLQLVCPKSALDIPRVRAVADLLVKELRHVQETKPSQKPEKRVGR